MSKQPLFSISERKFFLRIIDILVVIGTIFLASSYLDFTYFEALDTYLFTWLSTLIFYMVFFGQVFEMYNLKTSSSRFLIVRSIAMTTFFTTVFYIFTPIIAPVLPQNRMQILYLLATIFVPLVVWRFLYIWLVYLPKYHKYLLLIGESDELSSLINVIEKKSPDSKIVGYISENEIQSFQGLNRFNVDSDSIQSIIKNHNISEVVVSKCNVSQSAKVHNQLIHLFENGVPIISAKRFVENISFLVPEMEMQDSFYDYISLSRSHQSKLYISFIRLFDIIFALFGILFLTLLLPIVLVANLIANRGSLFYYQKRVGLKGKNFTIIKFRSMVPNAEKDGAVWAKQNDMRITKFGRFLRKTRLDEIPQFINILKGDMSLIGPRPERPEFVSELKSKIPFYAIRHVIKPGLTGWAQVMHPYTNTIEDYDLKVRYDLYYIKERNVLLDFRIVIKTITTVLFFRGN